MVKQSSVNTLTSVVARVIHSSGYNEAKQDAVEIVLQGAAERIEQTSHMRAEEISREQVLKTCQQSLPAHVLEASINCAKQMYQVSGQEGLTAYLVANIMVMLLVPVEEIKLPGLFSAHVGREPLRHVAESNENPYGKFPLF